MTNYVLADFVDRLNVASRNHLKSIKVPATNLIFNILTILYKNGFIRGFKISNGFCIVYLKYLNNKPCFCKMTIVSKPGRRKYISLGQLSLLYNANSLNGFSIISTSQGLISSVDALFNCHLSGELLINVKI